MITEGNRYNKVGYHITKIKVKGLWDTFDIEWKLNPHVNILAGSNGSGKSTILRMLYDILEEGKLSEDTFCLVNNYTIEFSNGMSVINANFHDTFEELQKMTLKDSVLLDLKKNVERDLGDDEDKKQNAMIMASSTIARQYGRKIPLSLVLSNLSLCKISTFDIPLPSEEDSSRTTYLSKQGVKTNIDLQLFYLQERYAYYLANLAKQVEKFILNNRKISDIRTYIEKIYSRKNLFVSILNEFLNTVGKSVDENDSMLRFITPTSNRPLRVYSLSAGEKQIVYILLSVLLQEDSTPVMIMDEPEISLHVDWQRLLIDKIRQLNPNCQIIISTHSPSVLLNGWLPFVTELDELKHKTRR